MAGSYKEPGYYEVLTDSGIITLPEQYSYLKCISFGSCSQVHCAFEKDSSKKVAIKKIQSPFQDKDSAKRTLREIKLLKHVKHENIIDLLDIYTPDKCTSKFDNIYLVTPYLEMTLGHLLKTKTLLTDDQLEFIVFQVFRGLRYLHMAGIIHRDLKPANIAVNENLDLKILDFGLARTVDVTMTGYVTTRWYRAPEVITNWEHYTQSMDIWSLGCIIAELMTGEVLLPGSDYLNQLALSLKLVGTPCIELLNKVACPEAIDYILTLPPAKKICFHNKFNGRNPELIKLVESMLDFDPCGRITAEQALNHNYLKIYHCPNCKVEKFDHNFERKNLKISDWKNLVWQEIKIINFLNF